MSKVYPFCNETGEGTITAYKVFPGVSLACNDFHMRYYDSSFRPDRELLCIDHCREGRLEYPAKENAFSYMEAGDLKLDRRLTHTGHFEFPLSHYAAYHILEGLRLRVADRFLHAPLGEVTAHSIGEIKNLMVDKIEDIEPPLAHMIPEGMGHLALPIVSIIALACIDWRLALASLATVPLSLICMVLTFRISGKNFDQYVQSNTAMNSTIVEYIEGIEVIKLGKNRGVRQRDQADGDDGGGIAKILDMPELPEPEHRAELSGYDVTLKHVRFSYSGQRADEVLHGIDLTLPQGGFTALVGPSGGGKSTIAKLIARFWDVTEGEITIGGVNVQDIPLLQLADTVSFVTQDNVLFRCSLKENIRLGNPNASDAEVYAAARAAQCEEFISKLPQGYDTPAGEAGKRLSGGEKQRIAIARMILKNVPVVILDEATAFTDPENEEKLQQSIAALTRGKTLLVIAHRLATIQNADQILVLDHGQIVQKGTHRELIAQPGRYRSFVETRQRAEGWNIA